MVYQKFFVPNDLYNVCDIHCTNLSSRLRVKLIFILFFTATGISSALSTSYLAEIKDSKLTHG
jgi:hypothetical protein